MSNSKMAPVPGANEVQWDQNEIYLMLSDPMRRGMLLSMARKGPNTATVLAGGGVKRTDSALKHLVCLRAAGLVITKPNPNDGRRLLYALSPAVSVTLTETGAVIDFVFCVVRL
ncbi:MAG: hypothetical protein JWM68_995 [Verrucomicrobiales bacterium]|nr:hypothetical protein [Verrucomicrobiales bacterium]